MSKSKNNEKKRKYLPLVFGGIFAASGLVGGSVLIIKSLNHDPQPTTLVTLKFNANGGTIDGGKDTIQAEQTTTFSQVVKPSVTSPGYLFTGWYSDVDGKKPISPTAPISNVPSIIYAGWSKEVNIKVNFKAGSTEATFVGPTTVGVTKIGTKFNEINKPIAISPDTTKVLDHWSKNEGWDNPMAADEVIPEEGIDLYPVFIDAPTSYVLIKFDSNEGEELQGTTEFNVPMNTLFGTISKPLASKKGKDFVYWSLEPDGEKVEDDYKVEGSVTFYAHYENVNLEEKVSFQDSETNKTYWLTNPSATSGPLVFQDLDGETKEIERSKFNETIHIGTEIKSIGINFLYECYSFNNGYKEDSSNAGIPLVIPANVESIGDSFLHLCIAFNQPIDLSRCKNLTSIGSSFMQFCTTFNNDITWPTQKAEELTIGAFFLQSCLVFNKEMKLPDNIKTIPGSFMGSCERFNNGEETYDSTKEGTKPFIIPSSVTSIQSYFLSSCFAGLIDGNPVGFNQPIQIPASVTAISEDFLYGNGAFNSSITFDRGCQVTTFEDAFLTGCTRFNRTLAIPASVTKIGDFFMYECVSFKQAMSIPTSVTYLGNSFMSNCQKFNSNLILHSKLTHIGSRFLYYCHSMTSRITISCNPSTVFASEQDLYTLGSGSPTSPCVITGIQITGDYATAFMDKFVNRIPGVDTNDPPYRNLHT